MRPRHLSEPLAVRFILTGTALAFLVLFLFLPLVVVFTEALQKGLGVYIAAIRDPVALSAIRLTLLVTVLVVPLNATFGVAAAWAIDRKSTRLNSSHLVISYAVFCLKKKK